MLGWQGGCQGAVQTATPSRAVALPAPSLRPQVWSQAPAGLGLLVFYWTLLYVATAVQEDKLHVE